MRKRNRFWRDCIECTLLIWLAAVLIGCAKKDARVGMRQDFRMGPFTIQAVSLDAYTRSHQGVPFEVEVRLRCTGGNRFDRLDFQELVSKKGRAYVRTSSGWRERVWVLARGEQAQDFIIQANPPLGSSGFILEIGNPYAKGDDPERFIVDLGR